MAKLNSDLLDDLTIKAAKPKAKQYTLRDGNGLFLLVHPNGSKYFQLRTTLHNKRKLIQLGTYPALSLSEARDQSRDKRKQVKVEHIDPILEGKLAKQRKSKDADNTFQKVAEDWLVIKQRTLAPSTLLKIKQTFNANVYGVIGKYPIKDIDNLLVRKCLLIMQNRGALEFMEKTRGWIKSVFDFALSDKLIAENPIPLKDERLEKHVSEKYPHLESKQDAGKFLRNLFEYGGSFEVATCVYLQLHFAQRPSELRCSKWVEFDLDKAIWTLPLEKSKSRKYMKKPHTIMLSKQAILAIKELQAYTGHSEYLFAARFVDRPVSEASIRKAFRLTFTDYHTVPHGCRHFFSTQANESGLFRNDVIESFLSHSDKDKIREIYNEATYDKERRQLAQWWSDQLDIMRDEVKFVTSELQ
ncbi:tyrosine-type recombinase/integrase [Methylotenera versatilis]|uniref:Integrase family protein n=1 Tax=Methylotenera versatilis (strain 301) TaxID=666681 RepID=D7DJE3_METV0|nr:integrase arm-type DNA-binding domain-containing protein [Methylotenera versatilis]ADI30178.1 integrase family protein [Methylotenera versatilis 301]